PLMQLLSVTGVFGVTFLVAWLPATVVSLVTPPVEWTTMRGPVVACGLVSAVVLIAGALRLSSPASGPVLRVATLTRPTAVFAPGEITRVTEGRVLVDDPDRLREKVGRMQSWFLERSREAAAAGVRVVAWAEGNLLVFVEDEPAFLERARQ